VAHLSTLQKNNGKGPTLDSFSERAGLHLSLFFGDDAAKNYRIFVNTWKYSLDKGSVHCQYVNLQEKIEMIHRTGHGGSVSGSYIPTIAPYASCFGVSTSGSGNRSYSSGSTTAKLVGHEAGVACLNGVMSTFHLTFKTYYLI
jgi:hypothetical protein